MTGANKYKAWAVADRIKGAIRMSDRRELAIFDTKAAAQFYVAGRSDVMVKPIYLLTQKQLDLLLK